jgi:hypothetical protein
LEADRSNKLHFALGIGAMNLGEFQNMQFDSRSKHISSFFKALRAGYYYKNDECHRDLPNLGRGYDDRERDCNTIAGFQTRIPRIAAPWNPWFLLMFLYFSAETVKG